MTCINDLYKAVLNICSVKIQLSGLWSPLDSVTLSCPLPLVRGLPPSGDSWAHLQQPKNILHKVQTCSRYSYFLPQIIAACPPHKAPL